MSKMRDMFLGYYQPDQDEFEELWKDAIIILDTNVLLNLYMYSIKTKDIWIGILSRLQSRIWSPYYVVLEYNRNRISKIVQQQKAYENIQKAINNSLQKLSTKLNQYNNHPIIDIGGYLEQFSSLSENLISRLKYEREQLPAYYSDHQWMNSDPIQQAIEEIFGDKISQKYDDSRQKELFREGEERYRKNIPPGFMDSKKKNAIDRYGDLLIWFQILDIAISNEKPIIFVTDDRKKDWWNWTSDVIVGPHPELMQEFYEKTNNRCYIYTAQKFFQHAAKFLDIDLSTDAVQETDYVGSGEAQFELLEYIHEMESFGENEKTQRYHEIARHWLINWFMDNHEPHSDFDLNRCFLLSKDNYALGFTIIVTAESYGQRFMNILPIDATFFKNELLEDGISLNDSVVLIVFRNEGEYLMTKESLESFALEFESHIIGGIILEEELETFEVLFNSFDLKGYNQLL